MKLWPYPGIIGSDYVNANFIDVSSSIIQLFSNENIKFLMTFTSRKHAIGNFLLNLYDYSKPTYSLINEIGLSPIRASFMVQEIICSSK